jgi:hypothetical protein
MIKLNSVTVKSPTGFSMEIVDVIATSDRNTQGEALIDRVSTKRGLSLEWSYLKQSEIEVILDELSDVFVDVEYPDAELGTVTKTFKIDSKQMPKSLIKLGGEIVWERLSVELTER